MIKKAMRVMNSCSAILKDSEGNVVDKQVNVNTTCYAGRGSMAERLIDNVPETSKLGVIQLMAIGDGLSTALETDTKLENELERSIVDLSTATIDDTVVTVDTTFPIGLQADISEAGLFVDSTSDISVPNSGKLLAHSRFSTPIQKLSTQTLTIIWVVSIVNTI